VPRFLMRREKRPLVFVRDLNFFGPRVTTTLCGALPCQRQVTVVPLSTLTTGTPLALTK